MSVVQSRIAHSAKRGAIVDQSFASGRLVLPSFGFWTVITLYNK
jgi:hypothetical protein